MTKTRSGGSFAPPLSDELLATYEAQIDALAAGPVKEVLQQLLRCVTLWWQLPASTGEGSPHPSGRGVVIPLDSKIAASLEALIPWNHELAAMQQLLDTELESASKDLRNAAYHLLWHVRELDLDREPITNDQL